METAPDPSPPISPESETPRPTAHGIERGSFNVCIGVVGAPGSGKSTYALARATQLSRESRAYLLVHDLGHKLPDRFPGGQPTGIVRHDSVEECRDRLRNDPRGAHCIPTEDAEDVIDLACEVAQQSMDDHGGRGYPAIVLIDEAVSAADTNPYRLGSALKQTMALRRHRNVGILWTSQSPNLCHYQMLCIGTEIVSFRLYHAKDFAALERAGFSPQELAAIRTLKNYHWVRKICK